MASSGRKAAEPASIGGEGVRTVAEDNHREAYDPGLVGVLADKVLLGWLRNRYQLLFPFPLNLKALDEAQADLLAHAMIAAAEADGALDETKRERINAVISLVGEVGKRALFVALEHPKPLNVLLRDVRGVQLGAVVYAASLMAADQRKTVSRLYLKYLAARLQLSPELVHSLEQRFHPNH
jgi:uncharacterized membrane protein YebE (DUF533 family)